MMHKTHHLRLPRHEKSSGIKVMKEKGEEAIAHFHFMLAGSLQLPRNQQL
jgi:hypothetical protein